MDNKERRVDKLERAANPEDETKVYFVWCDGDIPETKHGDQVIRFVRNEQDEIVRVEDRPARSHHQSPSILSLP